MIANYNRREYWPPGSRPHDPTFDGRGLKFETLDHGGDHRDAMPLAIRITDRDGNVCEYMAVNPRQRPSLVW